MSSAEIHSLTTTPPFRNEIRRVTITDLGGISGSLSLIFKGQTTSLMAYNANAAAVQAALVALSNINPEDVIVTEAGLSGQETMDVFIEFAGQYVGQDITAADFQLGTTPSAASVALANTRQGGTANALTAGAYT